VETQQPGHPASWWAQFAQVSERFDAAIVTEGLGAAINAKIAFSLLRREAEIATEVVVAHLNKPASTELAERAEKTVARLVATVERLGERAGEKTSVDEAYVLCQVLQGRFDEAAALMEPVVGTPSLLRIFVSGLRLEHFDTSLTVRLLREGQTPADAIRCGLLVGKYGWWPSWLLKTVTERALAGQLDEETVTALDQCAYADLSPIQARTARRLLAGDQALMDTCADRLNGLGEHEAAAKLRDGDLSAVALAARLLPR
jgi:hypothetical protein